MEEKLPVVVIVGRPNVGKSTLFNRLIRQRVAVVEDEPGITRDRLYAEAEYDGVRMSFVDTGGILYRDDDPLIEQIRMQAQVAMEEADVVIFLTDTTAGSHPDDRELANRIRNIKKPILVVVNKSDNPQRDVLATEFYELGLGEIYPISSLHGRGVDKVIDRLVELVPKVTEGPKQRDEIRLALVGRPNVGKSSMVNAFTGEQRAIVSNIPGTTRDAVDTLITYKGQDFRIVDTAGIRRRGKVQGSVEYYMVHRATGAIEKCDCAVVIVDAHDGITDGDKRVAKLAHDEGKAVVIVINKWDLIRAEDPDDPLHEKGRRKGFHNELTRQFPELAYATLCFVSAKENTGLETVLEAVLKTMDSYSFRVATGPLNRVIGDAVYEKPLSRKGRLLKIYYSTQVRTRPPSFALFCNDPDLVHFSYLRYLERKLREAFPLNGTQIRLLLRSSHEKKEKKGKR